MANRNDEFLSMSNPAPQEEVKESNEVLIINNLFKSYGRGKNKKELPAGKESEKSKEEKLSWELDEEEKNQVNNRAIQLSNQQQNQSITDKDIEDR